MVGQRMWRDYKEEEKSLHEMDEHKNTNGQNYL